jgi:hypothetical protein
VLHAQFAGLDHSDKTILESFFTVSKFHAFFSVKCTYSQYEADLIFFSCMLGKAFELICLLYLAVEIHSDFWPVGLPPQYHFSDTHIYLILSKLSRLRICLWKLACHSLVWVSQCCKLKLNDVIFSWDSWARGSCHQRCA